jgi:hypothetical protein
MPAIYMQQRGDIGVQYGQVHGGGSGQVAVTLGVGEGQELCAVHGQPELGLHQSFLLYAGLAHVTLLAGFLQQAGGLSAAARQPNTGVEVVSRSWRGPLLLLRQAVGDDDPGDRRGLRREEMV